MKRFLEMGFPRCTVPVFTYIEKFKLGFTKFHVIWGGLAKLVPTILAQIATCEGVCGATVTAGQVASFGVIISAVKSIEFVVAKLVKAMDSLNENMKVAETLCRT